MKQRVDRISVILLIPGGIALKKIFLLASVAAALFTTTANAATNLVANGGFEITTLTGKGHFENNVADWTGGGGSYTFIDFHRPTATDPLASTATSGTGGYAVYGPLPISPAGGNFVQADGDTDYSKPFSQGINGLIRGQVYALTFYQAAGQQSGFKGPTTERWQVLWAVPRSCRTYTICPPRSPVPGKRRR